MNLDEVLHFRRAVRVFDPKKPLDTEKVRHCIALSTLAPTSSNMQLWEFYHITDKETMQKISRACMGQPSTATAQQIVVFVTRQDLYRERAREVLSFERGNVERNSPEDRVPKRVNDRKVYYGKLMPFLYARFFRLIGLLRKLIVLTVGIFRPVVYEVSETDMNAVVQKSCALAAQTFMIAMANEGYDTCPLEGFDSHMVRKILHLPHGAGINMVIPCGIRKGNEGIWGERFRIPFEKVYKRI